MSGGYHGGYDDDWDSGDPRDPRNSGGYPRPGGDPRPGSGGVWGSDAPLPGENYGGSQGTGASPVRNGGWDERQLPPRGGDPRPPAGGYGRSGPQQARPGTGPEPGQRGSGAYPARDGRRDPRDSGGYTRPDGRRDPQGLESGGRSGAYPQGREGGGTGAYPRGTGDSRDIRDSRDVRDSRDNRGLRDDRDPRDGRDYRQTGGSRMAGNNHPGDEFLPGLDGTGDWDYEDRRRGRRGQGAQAGGAPARGDRYPVGRYGQYRDDRAVEDRYDEDAYVGDGYAADRYEQDRYERGSYDQDQYAGDRDDRGRYRDDDDSRFAADGRGRGKPKRKRSRARRLAPWIALLVLLVFIVPLAGGGIYAYKYLQAKNHPPDYPGAGAGPQVLVQVMTGDTPTSLAPRLVADGVVESDRAFILAAEDSTSTANLEAGFFLMNKHMKASLAYSYLLNPKNLDQHTVTIPEGYRTVDAIKVLAAKSRIPLADFQKVLGTPSLLAQLALPPYSDGKPEGYLFPATYAITPHETALAILQAMTDRFAQEAVSANLPASVNVPAKGGTVHLTEGQIIIVASLLQAEAGSVADMPKIAEVAYNRLKAGMPLQFDSSVFYGLGKYGTAATNAEIATPGPYNTYKNKGLPPGPIDNPGDAAIQAALHPATGNLVYFFGCPSGKTIYSATTALTKASC